LQEKLLGSVPDSQTKAYFSVAPQEKYLDVEFKKLPALSNPTLDLKAAFN
jgi:hypothetical protein